MKSSAFALPVWIGLFLFSIYLLSFSGKLHVMDELAVFTAGNNLAQYGRADINPLIWTNHWTPHPPGIWGQDGNLYTKKAPGISFITVPLLWIGHTLPGLNAVHIGLLANVIVTALTAGLLFVWLIDLGFSRPAATLTALGYGLCTIAWVYARMFWGLSILGFCFLVAVWAARRATSLSFMRRRWPWFLLCGTAAALGLTLRFEAGMAIVLVGLYLLTSLTKPAIGQERGAVPDGTTPGDENGGTPSQPPGLRRYFYRGLPNPDVRVNRSGPQVVQLMVLYLSPTVVIGLGLAYFNFVRYGSLGETGYTQEILFKAPWIGGFGLLFSPGNGLFLYAPFMLLLFFGLRPAWRRLPHAYFLLIAAICLFYWLFYGSWFAWGGTWGWGPRFFLPTLPLLMLFVAEPLEWLTTTGHNQRTPYTFYVLRFTFRLSSRLIRVLAWLGIAMLVFLSLTVNFLGIAVDFNEHFLRLGRNDNFVFNWAAFPPLGHWRILQDGLVDIIWLQPGPTRLVIEGPVLVPALILVGVATMGLILAYRGVRDLERSPNCNLDSSSVAPSRISRFMLRPLSVIPAMLLAVGLTYQMMLGTAQVTLTNEQTRIDLPALETLTSFADSGDSLLIPMPPFGDAQEISTLAMAFLDRPLPTYAWIESEPRAIHPDERELVWRASTNEVDQIWLFERWLSQNDPTSLTTTRLNQQAFLVQEQWFEQSGKLSLYALANGVAPTTAVALNVPFQGGVSLVDFSVFGDSVAPGAVLKIRLTWQALAAEQLTAEALPAGGVVGFVHLLDETASRNIAQQDRLLLDLQNVDQSPLLPGQTVTQGYGLRLPDDLAPGVYPLIAGLYLANTGQALNRADDSPDDFLYLTNISVQP